MRRLFWFAAVIALIGCFGNAPALATTVNVPGFEQAPFTNATGAWLVSSIVAEPDGSENVGTVYLVAPVGLGDFSTHSDNIAILTANQGWYFIPPSLGMLAYVQDTKVSYTYTSTGWVVSPSASTGTFAGTLDAKVCGVKEDGVTDDTAALNACLAAAPAEHVSTVAACGQTIAMLADIIIPAGVTLDGCSVPPSLNMNNYTLASGLQGILVHSPSYTIYGAYKRLVVERGGDIYSPATFAPVTVRDALNATAAMAGTGSIANSPGTQITDVMVLGFNQCWSIVSGAAGANGQHLHGDCTNGILFNGLGAGTPFTDVGVPSYLTHGLVAVGALDNVLTSGSNYKAVIAIPPTDTSSTIALKNGDTVYVSISPFGGAQSLGDKQTLSCGGTGGACAVVNNGTDGCGTNSGAPQCQEAIIAGSSVTPVTLTATWTAGTQSNGVAYPMVVPSIAGLAVGQGISTSGACSIAANVTIKDVFAIGDTFFVTPSVPNTCPGTAQSVTFSDGATVAGVFTAGSFTHDGRGVEVSGVQRSGSAAHIVNGGGASIDGFNGYTHDVAIDCDTGGSNSRFTNLALGINDPLGDHANIGIHIHGNHTGNDCDNFEVVKGEASQHITRPIVVESDGAKINRFGFLNIGPAPGKSTGTAFDVEAGKAVFANNSAKNTGNLIVADGTTYRILYPDSKHLGTGYTAGNTVTTNNGTCSTPGQLVIDTVDVSGIPLTWHQSVQPVGCSWPSDFTVTGGSGSGLQLVTDGLITSTAVVTGNAMPNIDFYVQTPSGTAFSGVNNLCTILTACNINTSQYMVTTGGTTSVKINDVAGRILAPEDFGMVANSSLADVTNLAALNTAIAACNAGTIGGILFPAGKTYQLSGNPNPITANLCDFGGSGTTATLAASATGNLTTFFTVGDDTHFVLSGSVHDLILKYLNTPAANSYAINIASAADYRVSNITCRTCSSWAVVGNATAANNPARVSFTGLTGDINKGLTNDSNILIQNGTGINFSGTLNGVGDCKTGNPNGSMVRIKPVAGGVVDTVYLDLVTQCYSGTISDNLGKPIGLDINYSAANVNNVVLSPRMQLDHTTTYGLYVHSDAGSSGAAHVFKLCPHRISTDTGAAIVFDGNNGQINSTINVCEVRVLDRDGTVPVQVLAAHGGGSTNYKADSFHNIKVQDIGSPTTPAAIQIDADGWSVDCSYVGTFAGTATGFQFVYKVTNAALDVLHIGRCGNVPVINSTSPLVPVPWISEPVYTDAIAPSRDIYFPRPDGVQTFSDDAGHTVKAQESPAIILITGTYTANRTINLANTETRMGQSVEIDTAASLGAFNAVVKDQNSGATLLTEAASKSALFMYENDGAWHLIKSN